MVSSNFFLCKIGARKCEISLFMHPSIKRSISIVWCLTLYQDYSHFHCNLSLFLLSAALCIRNHVQFLPNFRIILARTFYARTVLIKKAASSYCWVNLPKTGVFVYALLDAYVIMVSLFPSFPTPLTSN